MTERTYLRHFADTPEGLFEGESELRAIFARSWSAPADAARPGMIVAAFTAAVLMLVANLPIAERCAAVIAVARALTERPRQDGRARR